MSLPLKHSDSKNLSWGRSFSFTQAIRTPFWHDELAPLIHSLCQSESSILAGGLGRSYGDSCLNSKGVLVRMNAIHRIMAFDAEAGLITCEAGASFAQILELVVPKGWFLPVTPGTMWVTVGGAVANDVHGKNHHVAGTFGCHVESITLLKSNGEVVTCSLDHNRDLFCATIGGLGLTGIILVVRFRLKKVGSPHIRQTSIKFKHIDEFVKVDHDRAAQFDYNVAWIDSSATGRNLGRGIYLLGNHFDANREEWHPRKSQLRLRIPVTAPDFALNRFSMKAFNLAYFHRQSGEVVDSNVSYQSFFYPLDVIERWNLLYGKRGFYQFQCVIPVEAADQLPEFFRIASHSRLSSFLTVLKKFGDIPSPGMISFPRPGYTIAFDFRNVGQRTRSLFKVLSELTMSCGGRMYPAKDAMMTKEEFALGYPNWDLFARFVDPNFSSDFWRRVAN